MGAITVSGLNRAAEKYDPILKKLPFIVLMDKLAELEINLKEVTYKDTIIAFQRKAGIAKPYAAGTIDLITEIGKLTERELIVLPCYSAIKDHIQNYRDKAVLNPSGDKVDNASKKHPLEQLFLETQVRTVGEDILDSMFPATRDTSDKSPMGMIDGFFTQVATEISGGAISAANKNYSTSGAFSAPSDADDTDAIDDLITWLRKANYQLLKNAVLYMSPSILYFCQDALENKLKYRPTNGFEAFQEYLRSAVHSPNLRVISDPVFGAGSQLILSVPRNLDLGMNTKSDANFVQVRSPYEDPNYAQFWMQWELGARINSLHEKEFFCNEQTNTATEMSGDYTS
jgi:hypothetical protein